MNHKFNQSAIEQLTQRCEQCQKHGRASGQFKFTLKDDDIQFNCNIIIDIFYLKDGQDDKKKPVLHVVNENTAFQAAQFLLNISALHV